MPLKRFETCLELKWRTVYSRNILCKDSQLIWSDQEISAGEENVLFTPKNVPKKLFFKSRISPNTAIEISSSLKKKPKQKTTQLSNFRCNKFSKTPISQIVSTKNSFSQNFVHLANSAYSLPSSNVTFRFQQRGKPSNSHKYLALISQGLNTMEWLFKGGPVSFGDLTGLYRCVVKRPEPEWFL